MLTFDDLANLMIQNERLTIRRYHESDYFGLTEIFKSKYFKWFFKDYACCQEFVDEKIAEYHQGKLIMLVIIDNLSQKIIGSSSLYEISFRHKRLEMGSSWLDEGYHGSAYNAMSKLALIDCLLNRYGFNRIQWKTDALNDKSKQAMIKLGFVYEGVLRRHAITASGRVRDSLVFAVTDLDWPVVANTIEERIITKLGSSQ